jgi:DNA-binding NtrC family response regulator
VRPGGDRPNVLLEGEAGTGKSLVASLLHRLGRAQAPVVAVDCAAAPGTYLRDVQLAGARIVMPPLRQRGDDALIIANRLLPQICAQHHRPRMTLAPEVGQRFLEHIWPGNVRELTRMLRRAVLLSTGSVISAEALGRSWSPPISVPPGG